jgi:hypothetical protein
MRDELEQKTEREECEPTAQQVRDKARGETFKAYAEQHNRAFEDYECRTQGTHPGEAPPRDE